MDGTGDVWYISSLPFLEGQFRAERPGRCDARTPAGAGNRNQRTGRMERGRRRPLSREPDLGARLYRTRFLGHTFTLRGLA